MPGMISLTCLQWLQGMEIQPTAEERVGIYRRFTSYMKDYFYDDALGKRRAFYFLPWHFEFFCRYRPYPAELYESSRSDDAPLMSFREGMVNEHVCPSLAVPSALYHESCNELRCGAGEQAEALRERLFFASCLEPCHATTAASTLSWDVSAAIACRSCSAVSSVLLTMQHIVLRMCEVARSTEFFPVRLQSVKQAAK
jgi:hypothetical protein